MICEIHILGCVCNKRLLRNLRSNYQSCCYIDCHSPYPSNRISGLLYSNNMEDGRPTHARSQKDLLSQKKNYRKYFFNMDDILLSN